jgi:hypothetical protein
MKQPISVTMRKIGRWSIKKQYEHLLTLIAEEKPRSVRRTELVAAVAELVQRDLKAGNRGLRRNQFSERQSQERVNECA